jgi:hypothetical protein
MTGDAMNRTLSGIRENAISATMVTEISTIKMNTSLFARGLADVRASYTLKNKTPTMLEYTEWD